MALTAFLGEQTRSQLAGFVCAPHATTSFEVPSAVERATLGNLPQGTPADVAVAVTRARDAQRSWAALPAYFRLAPLRRLPTLVQAYQNLLADVLRAEAGGSLESARELANTLAGQCREVTRSAPRALRPVKHRGRLRVTSLTVRDPVGVIGVVPAVGLEPAPVAAALLAGNAVVVVPEGRGSFGALLLAQLLDAARLPRDLVQVVPGTTGLADALPAAVDRLLLPVASARSDALAALADAAGTPVSAGAPRDPAAFTTPRRVDRR